MVCYPIQQSTDGTMHISLFYCQAIVEEVQKITGFDRVMVDRFHTEGERTLIAEAANE